MTNPRFLGLWNVNPLDLYFNASANRWYLYSDGLHEGPVLKFKGFDDILPPLGAPVHIGIHAVECLKRGWLGHRPPIHWELKVTPYRGARPDLLEPLNIVREDPGFGCVCRIHGDAWLVRGDVEPAEKHDPEAADITRYLDPEYSASLLGDEGEPYRSPLAPCILPQPQSE